MSWLITPHSGLSMKRTDRMVGIDGTAHGRMKSTDSHLIHQRDCTKKPDSTSATTILRLMPTSRNTSVLTTERAEDRVVDQLHVALRMARQPQAVADRVEHEDEEHQQIGHDQQRRPRSARASRRAGRVPRGTAAVPIAASAMRLPWNSLIGRRVGRRRQISPRPA